jgi:predicted ATPase/DNA-binding SARP family transcriptional activator
VADVVRIRLLGGFGASTAGRSLPASAWRLRKAKTLIKLLALEPAHTLHRDQLIDALWPELDPDAGRNNLHQVVHAARKALSALDVDGSAVLEMHDDLLTLGRGTPVLTDLDELQSAVRDAEAAGHHDRIAELLHESPGELLPEDAYEPWLHSHAAAFQAWRAQLVMDVAEAQLGSGEADRAVVLLAPVVGVDPLNEPASRAMMRALAGSGRRSEALMVYERLRDELQDKLASEPEATTRELFRDLLTDDDGSRPPVAIPAQRTIGDLPAPVSSLVGRTRELVETKAILERTRLLTLTGLGGAGKTTLAIELARRCAQDYPDGVHLVELAALSDSRQVGAQIARTVRLDLPSGSPPVEAMIAQLANRTCLVVLDNCEHLLEGCALVAHELLRGCPGLRILATSREPLRIEGEVSWRTPSLDLPDPTSPPDVSELAEVEAVQLFMQRASAALPTFALTDDNSRAVADICYRLDGIPLALELAAACIPVLSPQQIADRLNDSLNLLRRGNRASITRQQTLEATLVWSYNLLDDDAQLVFRQLSIFAGSFTLDAVEFVSGPRLSQQALLAAIARLVDTSLVTAEATADETRYRLLETVRQYAAEQLKAAGEHHATQQRHCDWYVGYAEARDPELSLRAAVLPETLDAEHDNLRVALGWSLQHQPDAAIRLAVALWRHWLARGFFTEGGQWLEAVLDAVPEPSAARARALIALGIFDIRRGTGERLAVLGAEAVRIHRASGMTDGLAQALHAVAVFAFMCGQWDECWQLSVESQEAGSTTGSRQCQTNARHLQAVVLMARGRLPEARAAFGDVLDSLPTLGDSVPPFLPPILLGFAVDTASSGRPRVYFEETVLLGRLVGAQQAQAYVLCNLADLSRIDGDLDEALEVLAEASRRFAELGDLSGEALTLSRRGCLHRRRGEFREAREALTHSLRIRESLGDRRAIGLTNSNLGVLTAAQGDVAAGRAMIEQALTAAREIHDGAARAGLTLSLASLCADAEDYESAERHVRAVLAESRHIPGNSRSTAWAHVMLGDILTRTGRPQDAAEAIREARTLFAAIGAVDGPTYLDVRAHAAGAKPT